MIHMTTLDSSNEEVLHYLAHRPNRIINGVISVEEWNYQAPGPFKPQSTAPRSVGALDKLPVETLHQCLGELDLISFARFMTASLGAKEIVDGLPGYWDLLETVGFDTFWMMYKAEVLSSRSLSTLLDVFLREQCQTCREEYGPFLHLLAGQRCCANCLLTEKALWMIPLPLAEKVFQLTEEQTHTLPFLWSIPGTYHLRYKVYHPRSTRLASLKDVHRLAIQAHGSLDSVPDPETCFNGRKQWKLDFYRRPLSGRHAFPSLASLGDGFWYVQRVGRNNDKFYGMDAIPFPTLNRQTGVVDRGLWCLGCRRTDWVTRGSAGLHISMLYERQDGFRVWSQAGLLEHAKSCPNAEEAIAASKLREELLERREEKRRAVMMRLEAGEGGDNLSHRNSRLFGSNENPESPEIVVSVDDDLSGSDEEASDSGESMYSAYVSDSDMSIRGGRPGDLPRRGRTPWLGNFLQNPYPDSDDSYDSNRLGTRQR